MGGFLAAPKRGLHALQLEAVPKGDVGYGGNWRPAVFEAGPGVLTRFEQEERPSKVEIAPAEFFRRIRRR